MTIFRAYDIRGVYPDDVNEEVFKKIGKALGTFIGGGRVCVGRDARECSPSLYAALIEGLRETGCSVYGVGGVPNAVCFFYGYKNKMPGAFVTASHNPVGWGGVKFFDERGASFVEQNQEVKKVYDSQSFRQGKGGLTHVWNAVHLYESFWKNKLKPFSGEKVVIECFGGAGAFVTPQLFENLGLTVVPLNAEPDPNFCGHRRPEPKGENLNELKKRVVEENALFGAAFDGDADRTVFVDDKGREQHGGVMGSLFIKHILSAKPGGSAVVTLDVTSNMDAVAESVGAVLHRSRVGHGFITKAHLDKGSLFACEWSSHYWFEYYPASEGP
ncbi:MAG: hypothetical protein GOU97_03465, partial [Nanoarchaeota archaeon]|nr:hypothetical protein [Nanoarchaeota archaeon]